MKIVLIGHYGMGNLGDDLMLASLLEYLDKRDEVARITVFCRRNYYQPAAKTRYIESTAWKKTLRVMALADSDCVIWGGGTCIHDQMGGSRLLRLAFTQKLSRLFGSWYLFLGIGIGNLGSKKVKFLAEHVLNAADYVYFREPYSLDAAEKIGFRKDCCVGGDLIFFGSFGEERVHRGNDRIRAISFSGIYDLPENMAVFYGLLLARLAETLDAVIHFIPAHTMDMDDNRFHSRMAGHIPPGRRVIHEPRSPLDYISCMRQVDFHIGMRLHSLAVADLLGVPNIGISYSPKVEYYIAKSGTMVGERLVKLGENIDENMVRSVFQGYRRPSGFICRERDSALDSLEKCLAVLSGRNGA